jgi:hypothetical protein
METALLKVAMTEYGISAATQVSHLVFEKKPDIEFSH